MHGHVFVMSILPSIVFWFWEGLLVGLLCMGDGLGAIVGWVDWACCARGEAWSRVAPGPEGPEPGLGD